MSYLAFGMFIVVVFWVLARRPVRRRAHRHRVARRLAARLLAAPLLIELVYAIFLQLVYVKSLVDIALGRSKHWNAATVETPSP